MGSFCSPPISPTQNDGRTKMKSYGIAITVNGTTYGYHVDSAEFVKQLVTGTTGTINKLEVTEQIHTYTKVDYRKLNETETLQLLASA